MAGDPLFKSVVYLGNTLNLAHLSYRLFGPEKSGCVRQSRSQEGGALPLRAGDEPSMRGDVVLLWAGTGTAIAGLLGLGAGVAVAALPLGIATSISLPIGIGIGVLGLSGVCVGLGSIVVAAALTFGPEVVREVREIKVRGGTIGDWIDRVLSNVLSKFSGSEARHGEESAGAAVELQLPTDADEERRVVRVPDAPCLLGGPAEACEITDAPVTGQGAGRNE